MNAGDDPELNWPLRDIAEITQFILVHLYAYACVANDL